MRLLKASEMAKSKYEYVKKFEREMSALPGCFLVVRIDGKGFHRFSKLHNFEKPNDLNALELMNKAAVCVFNEFNDIIIAYGQSDEYSFVFRQETDLYQRRPSKIMSTVVSMFTSSYVFHWSSFFKDRLLQYPPSFDARMVEYPSAKVLRDYLSWRQADCHINNLQNTSFWKLVQDGGLTPNEAQKRLETMLSGDKQEMLFSEFKTNYNNLPEIFKKGTIIIKECVEETVGLPSTSLDATTVYQSSGVDSAACKQEICKSKKKMKSSKPVSLHVDIIGDVFWKARPYLLGE